MDLSFFNTKRFFVNAVWLAAGGHFLDILTTEFITKVLHGYETNLFLVNPATGGLLLSRALVSKLFYLIFVCGTFAVGLKLTTKSWFVASLPFLYEAAWIYYEADASNIGLILTTLLRHLR